MSDAFKQFNPEDLKSRSRQSFGKIAIGKIIKIDAKTGLCSVATDDPGTDIDGCVWLTKSFTAPILGYRVKSLPSIGTGVILLVGNPSYIIDVIDTPDYDETFGLSLTKDGTFYREKYFADTVYPAHEGSASLLEGEFEIENAFNVGMSFLTNLVSLQASDRARVEAHLLNDMIRIIAEEYRNITPLGEVMVYDDGRPNMEINFGSYVHELVNKTSAEAALTALNGKSVSFPTLEKEDEAKGLNTSFGHRFKAYIGYVGNFLNMFVSDPLTNINAIASGKAQFYIGNSGDILLRTVSEIAIERVVRIAVPAKRDKKLSSPPDYENDEFLKKWDYGQGSENTIHQCAYSLRSYARYLSNYTSMMRFHQASKAAGDADAPYYIPSESEVPLPDMHNKEKDITDANGKAEAFIEGYSTIRIFRDGSILTMDSTGGSVYHGRGVVEISAVRDVRIDSARDISLIAGRHMFLKAKKNIEISSTEGGLVMKARKLLRVLCERGKIWIKSDAKKNDETPDADYGVLIDSPENRILINSKENTVLRQEEGDLLMDSVKGNAIMKAQKDCVIRSTQKNVFVQASEDFTCKSTKAFLDTKKFNVANRISMQNGNLIIRLQSYITRKLVVTGDLFSRPYATKQFVEVACCGDEPGTTSGIVLGEYNHVKKLDGQSVPTIEGDNITALTQAVSGLNQKIKVDSEPFTKTSWSFQKNILELPSDGSIDSLFVPHAQDFIETNPSDFTDYITWNFAKEDKLLKSTRTDDESIPYPGDPNQEECFADFKAGEVLNKPSEKIGEWDQPKIEKRLITRKVKK